MVTKNLTLLKIVTLALVLPVLNVSVNSMDASLNSIDFNYINYNHINNDYELFSWDEFSRANKMAQEALNNSLYYETSKSPDKFNEELVNDLLKFSGMQNVILGLNNEDIRKFGIRDDQNIISNMINNIVQLKINIENAINKTTSGISSLDKIYALTKNEDAFNLSSSLLPASMDFARVLDNINNKEFTEYNYDAINKGFNLLRKVDDFLRNNINNANDMENQEQNNELNNQLFEIQNNIDDEIEPENNMNINNSFNLLNDNIEDDLEEENDYNRNINDNQNIDNNVKNINDNSMSYLEKEVLNMSKSFKTIYNNLNNAIQNNNKGQINNTVDEIKQYMIGENCGFLELLLQYATPDVLKTINKILQMEVVRNKVLIDIEKTQVTLQGIQEQYSDTNYYGTFSVNDKDKFKESFLFMINQTLKVEFDKVSKLRDIIDNMQRNPDIKEEAKTVIHSLKQLIKELYKYKENNINNWEPIFKKAVMYNAKEEIQAAIDEVNEKLSNVVVNRYVIPDSIKGFVNAIQDYLPTILQIDNPQNIKILCSIEKTLKNSFVKDYITKYGLRLRLYQKTQDFIREVLNMDIKNITSEDIKNITTEQKNNYFNRIMAVMQSSYDDNRKIISWLKNENNNNLQNPVAENIKYMLSDYINRNNSKIQYDFMRMMVDTRQYIHDILSYY